MVTKYIVIHSNEIIVALPAIEPIEVNTDILGLIEVSGVIYDPVLVDQEDLAFNVSIGGYGPHGTLLLYDNNYNRYILDLTELSDVIGKGLYKIITDTTYATDSFVIEAGLLRVEATTLLDILSISTSKSFIDNLALSEELQSTWVSNRALEDTTSILGLLSIYTNKLLIDNLALSEELQSSWVAKHTLEETTLLSDSFNIHTSKPFIDSLALSDELQSTWVANRTLEEVASISDSGTFEPYALDYFLEDYAGILPGVFSINISKPFTDNLQLIETVLLIGTFHRTLEDNILLEDTLSIVSVFDRDYLDSVVLSDTLLANASKPIDDTLSILDINTLSLNKATSESISLTETIQLLLTLYRYTDDNLLLSESGSISNQTYALDYFSENYVGDYVAF